MSPAFSPRQRRASAGSLGTLSIVHLPFPTRSNNIRSPFLRPRSSLTRLGTVSWNFGPSLLDSICTGLHHPLLVNNSSHLLGLANDGEMGPKPCRRGGIRRRPRDMVTDDGFCASLQRCPVGVDGFIGGTSVPMHLCSMAATTPQRDKNRFEHLATQWAPLPRFPGSRWPGWRPFRIFKG